MPRHNPPSARQDTAEKKNAQLEALHRVGVALASSFDIDAILHQVATATVSLLGDVPVDIFYAGAPTIHSQPRWLPASPEPAHLSNEDRLRLERELAAAARRGLAVSSHHVEGRPGHDRPDPETVPIAVQDNMLGMIVVGLNRPLTQADRGLLSILSLQAATALHNIHLTQERIHFERLSAIGRMIGSVVHDFRSPLTAVRGYAGMLASLTLPDEDRRVYSRLIIEECDRLGTLTGELLELTRGNGSKPALRTIALEDFFRDLRPSLEAQFKDSTIDLAVELEYLGPVCLDPDRMTRAVLNVAANARQAIDGDGAFTIRSKQQSGRLVLEFEDSGSGIPAEVRHRIFEPFFSYGKTQGVGLGMCIVQKIVEEHGGETAVSSERGVGTTVRFLLPLETESVQDAHRPTAEVARGGRP